ncbi:MAG: GNAT family N-acetyltransferase [Bacteroidetes bacterium]|nr:GNAT family N-acetyltransferase [Bacteroidota bacterium]
MLKESLYKIYRKAIKLLPRLESEYFYALILQNSTSNDIAITTSYTTLSEDNINSLPAHIQAVFLQRLNTTKDKGYAYLNDKQSFAFLWVAMAGSILKIREIGKNILVKENEAWIYHVHTSEKYRNKGLSTKLFKEAIDTLKYTNTKRIHCYTRNNNYSMQAVLKKNEFKLYHKYFMLTIFNKSFCIFSRAVD